MFTIVTLKCKKKDTKPYALQRYEHFSEIGKFFKEKDATSAMNTITDMTDALQLPEKRLFGSESRCNCKMTRLQSFGLLILFPCFMIR